MFLCAPQKMQRVFRSAKAAPYDPLRFRRRFRVLRIFRMAASTSCFGTDKIVRVASTNRSYGVDGLALISSPLPPALPRQSHGPDFRQSTAGR
jgi:hypothetical protein